MWPFKTSSKPDPDPTLNEMLIRIIELETEWRAFLTQQTRFAARMAKRARDDVLQGPPVPGAPPEPQGHKAELRRRAFALRNRQQGGSAE